MKKQTKIIIAVVFAAIVLIAAGVGAFFGIKKVNEGNKTFTFEVVSERDNYDNTVTVTSKLDTFGDYLRTLPDCQYSETEYGIYVQGFNGYMEDMENQYWWCLYVNDESSMVGADSVPLADGDAYKFVLTQGW